MAFVNNRGLDFCLFSFFVCGFSFFLFFYLAEVGVGVLFHLNMELLKKKTNPNPSGL